MIVGAVEIGNGLRRLGHVNGCQVVANGGRETFAGWSATSSAAAATPTARPSLAVIAVFTMRRGAAILRRFFVAVADHFGHQRGVV